MSSWCCRIILSLLFWILRCNAFNLYKASHVLSKTTRLFDRLKYHEIVYISHNQFHHIDNGEIAIYPMNGKLEFHAFGRYYKLLIRKNVELFSDNFVIQHHTFNNITNTMQKTQSFDIPQCHYTAEIVSDESGMATNARFSACRGHGIQGWFHAFNETIVIRPKRLLTDSTFKGQHKINDPHIVYKYNDLDRSDYDTQCGHTHTHIDDQHDIIDIFDQFDDNMDKKKKKRRMQSTGSIPTRYVELAVVNDPGIIQEFGNDESLLILKAVQSVATVQAFYLSTDWGSNVGSIQVVLSSVGFIDEFTAFGGLTLPQLSCENDGNAPNLYQKTHTGPYCEVEYESYLINWHSFRSVEYAEYDNAHLLSYFDFKDSVIGYASISGMCKPSTSGGIDQVTYDDEYNGNIIAHEMGHNFGMQHDSTGNLCDSSKYIMAAKGSSAARPDSFSTCSISYIRSFFSWNTQILSCLDNKPLSTQYAVCRNGFVELGENCDCGQEDCTLSGDKCCDGSTCGLFAFAQCSNNDDCCQDCKIKSVGTECRELNDENSCDIQSESCDGKTSECPPDTFYIEGVKCTQIDTFGYCYNGICKTINEQCIVEAMSVASDDECGYSPNWQVNDGECSESLQCIGKLINLDDGSKCESLRDNPQDGTPCNKTGSNEAAQCVSDLCVISSTIYTYKWTTFAWSECSIQCKSNDNDAAGSQSREVKCTMMDGTVVDDIECNNIGINKPIDTRICNDYICNFCSFEGICGEHGECDNNRGICDCQSGFGGEFCNISPSLNFTGIVSQVYKDRNNGETIEERANPCYGKNKSISGSFDSATSTRTVPIDGVSTLNELYVGSTIGVRWRSGGSIDFLAVGMIKVSSLNGGLLNDNDWPFYVGNSLATDNGLCDDKNSSNSDECYNELKCNDFTFSIPTSIDIGYYKLIIRFNNIFNIESDILYIKCNDNNCNSTGHGQCNIDGTGCICNEGWNGDSCQYSVCDDWEFAICDKDDCGSSNDAGIIKPKCFSSTCDYNTSSSPCNYNATCSDPHFEGSYCEIPKDFCSTLSESECNNMAECEYILSESICVYSDCYSFKTQIECEGDINGTNYIQYDNKWSIFCKWNGIYCNRITCGYNILPQCDNGAVRKPLYDEYSNSPQSICNGWYCDCSTVENVENSHWTQSDISILLNGINNDYNFETNQYPLTTKYINEDSLDLFLCSSCSLQCENGGNIGNDNLCTNCYNSCPMEYSPFRSGIECNQVFWISSFRININYYNVIREKYDEFESLIIMDLAYFLGTDIKHISIWQTKPDGDKSIVYFRYLFDTNNDDETQIIGGDIMILAQEEISDDTSTASRGFIMKYIDSSYKYIYCIPTKEECDPNKQINFNIILLICFLSSFGVEIIIFCLYWFLTKEKREKQYEERVNEQKRVLKEMMMENKNATRIGMRNVSKKRAKQIASDKAELKQFEKEKAKKTVNIDEALSFNSKEATNHWAQHVMSSSDDHNQIEMETYKKHQEKEEGDQHDQHDEAQNTVLPESDNDENHDENNTNNDLPDGWELHYTEDNEPYYFDTVNQKTQWEPPQ